MTTASLFDGYTGTPHNNTQAGDFTGGLRFQPNQQVWVTALRWHPNSGAWHPTQLRLYDSVTGGAVASITSVPSSSSGSWETINLPTAVGLVAGREYRISFHQNVNPGVNVDGSNHGAGFVAQPLVSVIASGSHEGCVSTGDTYPASDAGDTAWMVDVVVTDVDPTGSPPATVADVGNQLAAWLSSTDGTHSDSAPLQDHTTLTTVASQVDATNGTVNTINTSVGAGLGANVSTALTVLSSIATIVTAIRDLDPVSALSTLLGNLQGASDAAATALQNISNHAVDVLNGHATTGSSTPHFAWVTAGDPVSFTTSTLLAVAADAYLLEITTPANGQALNTFSGVDVYFRSGWWCECIDGVGAERHYVDFRETWLRDGVRRLGGCLIVLQPGTQATITPYTLGPA